MAIITAGVIFTTAFYSVKKAKSVRKTAVGKHHHLCSDIAWYLSHQYEVRIFASCNTFVNWCFVVCDDPDYLSIILPYSKGKFKT